MTERTGPARDAIAAMFARALQAVDPRRAVAESLDRNDAGISIQGDSIRVEGSIVVVALGKAAVTMTQGALDALGSRIDGGIAITKDGHSGEARFDRIEICEASHPIPDERGVRATRRAIELVNQAARSDLILALISGGGSALFEAPRPPVTLADMASVTDLLLRAGADIAELNKVRTQLSLVKGGGFLDLVGERAIATLVLSDVLGNDPRVIASGPTYPGERDPAGARAVLDRFDLWDSVPASVRDVLSSPPPSETSDGRRRGAIWFVADNQTAVAAAVEEARGLGLQPESAWKDATGEARERGREWADLCLDSPNGVKCVVGGGEMTVTVRGDGVGGRNTEFALAAAMRLHERGDTDWVVASLATDGQDGPTGVAGAILEASDVARLAAEGFDLGDSLARNDTLAPILATEGAVVTGPTGTNVNDIYIGVRRS